jgi:acyl dehydratase
MELLSFADFHPGQIFRSPAHTVTADEIKEFAEKFDPQPFHLDEAAAAAGPFGGLAGSGWHTAALTMRLSVLGGLPIAGGIVGSLVEELRWHRPLRPGDTLVVESEVLEVVASKSRPGQGRLRMAVRTLGQDGAPVQSFVVIVHVRC